MKSISCCVFSRNITELKDIEKHLKNTVKELEQANQELDQFAYIASHDLKAPMRGIDNLAQWIAEDLESVMTEDVRENITLMRSRIARMEALLDDVLSYARAGQVVDKPEEVDVKALIEDIVESLALPESFYHYNSGRAADSPHRPDAASASLPQSHYECGQTS